MFPSSLADQWPWLIVLITMNLGLLKFIRDLYEARLEDCRADKTRLEARNAKWEELSYTALAIAQHVTGASGRANPTPGG
jgi:hypothetical protein